MIASALSWGLADPILSAPTLSWPMKDTNLGRLRFFPGQTDPTVSPVHFCTSFPGVFISLIYSPNYDQAEISASSCCLQTHHGVSVGSQMEDLRHNTFICALLVGFTAVNLCTFICKMEIMLLCPRHKGEERIFWKKNTCEYTLETQLPCKYVVSVCLDLLRIVFSPSPTKSFLAQVIWILGGDCYAFVLSPFSNV